MLTLSELDMDRISVALGIIKVVPLEEVDNPSEVDDVLRLEVLECDTTVKLLEVVVTKDVFPVSLLT